MYFLPSIVLGHVTTLQLVWKSSGGRQITRVVLLILWNLINYNRFILGTLSRIYHDLPHGLYSSSRVFNVLYGLISVLHIFCRKTDFVMLITYTSRSFIAEFW